MKPQDWKLIEEAVELWIDRWTSVEGNPGEEKTYLVEDRQFGCEAVLRLDELLRAYGYKITER